MGSEVRSWVAPPVLGVLFGSGARRNHTAESDIDLLLVRPGDLPDDAWDDQTESLSDHVAAWTGNDCRILTFTQSHVEERGANEPVLVDAAHEGVAFHGDMQGLASAVKSDTIGRRRARSKAT